MEFNISGNNRTEKITVEIELDNHELETSYYQQILEILEKWREIQEDAGENLRKKYGLENY